MAAVLPPSNRTGRVKHDVSSSTQTSIPDELSQRVKIDVSNNTTTATLRTRSQRQLSFSRNPDPFAAILERSDQSECIKSPKSNAFKDNSAIDAEGTHVPHDEGGNDDEDDDEYYPTVSAAMSTRPRSRSSASVPRSKPIPNPATFIPSSTTSTHRGSGNAKAIRDRFKATFNLRWTEQETEALTRAIQTFGWGNWKDISNNLGTRSPLQAKNRAKHLYGYPPVFPWATTGDGSGVLNSTLAPGQASRHSTSLPCPPSYFPPPFPQTPSSSFQASSFQTFSRQMKTSFDVVDDDNDDSYSSSSSSFIDVDSIIINDDLMHDNEAALIDPLIMLDDDDTTLAYASTDRDSSMYTSMVKADELDWVELPFMLAPKSSDFISSLERQYLPEWFVSPDHVAIYIGIRTGLLGLWDAKVEASKTTGIPLHSKFRVTLIQGRQFCRGNETCIRALPKIFHFFEAVGLLNVGLSPRRFPRKYASYTIDIDPCQSIPDTWVNGETRLVPASKFTDDIHVKCFQVQVQSNVLLHMDFHVHISDYHAVGLVGGYYDSEHKIISIQSVYPCSIVENADTFGIDNVSELKGRKHFADSGLHLVGWYRNCLNSDALVPSLQDMELQQSYQVQYEVTKGLAPVVGILISTPSHNAIKSASPAHSNNMIFFNVAPNTLPNMDTYLADPTPYELSIRKIASQHLDILPQLLDLIYLKWTPQKMSDKFPVCDSNDTMMITDDDQMQGEDMTNPILPSQIAAIRNEKIERIIGCVLERGSDVIQLRDGAINAFAQTIREALLGRGGR